MCVKFGVIKRSGAWFSIVDSLTSTAGGGGKDLQFAQGRDKAKLYLKENPEVMKQLHGELCEKLLFSSSVLLRCPLMYPFPILLCLLSDINHSPNERAHVLQGW